MRYLFDTNILVSSSVVVHPHHSEAFNLYSRSIEQKDDIFISAHTIAELYSIFTTLPILHPKMSGEEANILIRDILKHVSVVPLTSGDYKKVLSKLTKLDLKGGIIFDALIAHCAQKIKCDKLYTLNTKDFIRVWPEGISKIESPIVSD